MIGLITIVNSTQNVATNTMNLTVGNISEDLYAKLVNEAERTGRTLDEQLIFALEQSVEKADTKRLDAMARIKQRKERLKEKLSPTKDGRSLKARIQRGQ